MWFFVLQCFYFMLPAYFANMAPVIAKNWLKFLAVPVDFGKKAGDREIFGRNKTFRGFVFAVLFAILVTYAQLFLYRFDYFRSLSFVSYSNWILLGFLFGFGALFGDLAESFVKRRLRIKSGQKFFPWDQLDFVIGALIFVSILVDLTLSWILVVILISFIGHILVNHCAYYLKIRKEKW
ncbi:MAG: CDP-2,3-bis-(O-geranylgeranyl)-sn-glycerol synthase [Nanoarchaeota archaeon]|nr:CDP-2,3-bis-(O-geranylgeranyl)-sn-glycerol synthase [Nanoarchaeota archaeon]